MPLPGVVHPDGALTGVDRPVRHVAELSELPAEQFGVEVDEPLRLGRMYLEVHDEVRHDASLGRSSSRYAGDDTNVPCGGGALGFSCVSLERSGGRRLSSSTAARSRPARTSPIHPRCTSSSPCAARLSRSRRRAARTRERARPRAPTESHHPPRQHGRRARINTATAASTSPSPAAPRPRRTRRPPPACDTATARCRRCGVWRRDAAKVS